MLHAVNRKKARLHAFRGAGQRVPLEDVVTSTVFGPLEYIDQAEATTAISHMLIELGIDPPVWDGPTHLSLWPKKKTDARFRSNYVEPDAEIVDASGTALVIEVKWDAGLGPSELASQWLALNPDARRRSRHLFIARETGRYRPWIEQDRLHINDNCESEWPLHVVTWRRMADAFRVIGADISLNPGTRRWALGVVAFLKREDPLSISGWHGLGLEPVKPSSWVYRERWFSPSSGVAVVDWRFA